MTMLRQVHHFVLHPHVLHDPVTEATHAAIAAEAIDAAKGGHTVSLQLPTGADPVLVDPHADLDEVTAAVAEALPIRAEPDPSDEKPTTRRGKKAAALAEGNTDGV